MAIGGSNETKQQKNNNGEKSEQKMNEKLDAQLEDCKSHETHCQVIYAVFIFFFFCECVLHPFFIFWHFLFDEPNALFSIKKFFVTKVER